MSKLPCLFKRKGTSSYYFRKRIPDDLRGVYGKCEIKVSLRTSDLNEAIRKVHLASLKYDREFEEHRKQLAQEVRTELSKEDIERIADQWVHDQLEEDEQFRKHGDSEELFRSIAQSLQQKGASFQTPYPTGGDGWTRSKGLSDREYEKYQDTLHFWEKMLSHAISRGDRTVIEGILEEVMEEYNIRIRKESDTYVELAHALLKATKVANDASIMRHKGHYIETPPAPEPLESTQRGPLLSEIFEKWKVERQPPEKTANDFHVHIRRFIDMHGDLPIEDITKAHVREYKEAMLLYPARPSQKLKRLPLRRIVEKTSKDPSVPRLSVKTVNEKCLGAVSAILSWAVSNGYRDDNPASGIRAATAKGQARTPRQPYTVEDLNTIFSFPIYTQGERPKAGAGEAAKWLPLLALFTGARLEELGQLRVDDVRQDAGTGIWFFDINADEGKHLKTASSYRKVPVHPQLIELGFLEYHKEMKEQGQERLFPLLKSKQHDISTAAWSQWWGRYARKHGITDKSKVFHSFRHTVKDGFRDAGVPKPLYDALQGHAAGDVSDTYGRGYSLPRLQEAIDKLEFPGLDLGHLKEYR